MNPKTTSILLPTLLLLGACTAPAPEHPASAAPALRAMLAQKLMIDLRYWCEDGTHAEDCRTPLTVWPDRLDRYLRREDIGGFIWFSENLVNGAQIRALNDAAQHSARSAPLGLPLFVAIDQEGGRVARLPRHEFEAFPGNMALGASYPGHGAEFAAALGTAQGRQLAGLGFNINFAPNIDVNNNPANPVINVRSYGDDPAMVAALGGAYTEALQAQGVLATLKHFPGHGDTDVDSHTGLPRVAHPKARIDAVELAPYRAILGTQAPALVMTAHIQYPALDPSRILTPLGAIETPATLSRPILHDRLRDELKFDGLIISDALNMAGIAHYFTPIDATERAFRAGVDIGLMPFLIRTPEDLRALSALLDALSDAAAADPDFAQEIRASFQRIQNQKKRLTIAPAPLTSNGPAGDQALAQTIADAALQQLPASATLDVFIGKRLLALLPDPEKCAALANAWRTQGREPLPCFNTLRFEPERFALALSEADALLAASISPNQSLAEMGGLDDLETLNLEREAHAAQPERLTAAMRAAQTLGKPVLFVSLRAPYDLNAIGSCADLRLASFHYHVEYGPQGPEGTAYRSLAKALSGALQPGQRLPVQLPPVNPCNAHTLDSFSNLMRVKP